MLALRPAAYPDRLEMGNVNAANLKPEEIEEFSLMSNCALGLHSCGCIDLTHA